jgi:hypothetical protein
MPIRQNEELHPNPKVACQDCPSGASCRRFHFLLFQFSFEFVSDFVLWISDLEIPCHLVRLDLRHDCGFKIHRPFSGKIIDGVDLFSIQMNRG